MGYAGSRIGRELGGQRGAFWGGVIGNVAGGLTNAGMALRRSIGDASAGIVGARRAGGYLTSAERVARYEGRIQRLLAQGYGQGRNAARLGELQGRVAMMRRGFLRLGHGKYSGNKGIDAIYRHVGSGEIAVLESKFRSNWTAGRNPGTILGKAYGGLDQMSNDWIKTNIDNLLRSSSPYARNMGDILQSQGYQHSFINVMNAGGESFMYPW